MIDDKTKRVLSIVEKILEEDGIFSAEAIRVAMSILSGNGKPQKSETMILAKEAMRILGCSRPTLAKLEKDGKLHPTRYSARKMRFKLSEVNGLLEGPNPGMTA